MYVATTTRVHVRVLRCFLFFSTIIGPGINQEVGCQIGGVPRHSSHLEALARP